MNMSICKVINSKAYMLTYLIAYRYISGWPSQVNLITVLNYRSFRASYYLCRASAAITKHQEVIRLTIFNQGKQ